MMGKASMAASVSGCPATATMATKTAVHLPHTRSFLSSILNLQPDQAHQPIPPSAPYPLGPSDPVSRQTHHSSRSIDSSSPISSNKSSAPSSHTFHSSPPSSPSRLIPPILNILADPDEDEKPDKLKHFFASETALALLPDDDLNQLILSLLHQHREDLQPSGNPPKLPALVRSHSQRRPFPSAPDPRLPPRTPPYPRIHRYIPPALVLPPERLNATATEFKPTLVRATSMPFQPAPRASVEPEPVSGGLWAFAPSELGTPKYAPLAQSPAPSPAASCFALRPATPDIPRDPWLRASPDGVVRPCEQDETGLRVPDEDGKRTVSCPKALEWGLSPAMAAEMSRFEVWDSAEPPKIVHHAPVEEMDDERVGGRQADSTMLGGGDAAPRRAASRDRSPVKRYPLSTTPGTGSLPASPRFVAFQKPATVGTLNSGKGTSFIGSSSNHLGSSEDGNSSLGGNNDVNPAHRICRFYLQGCCLRSDCRFSHDVGKAICKFWLKGHCLKGSNRCDFLHEIPDLTSSSTTATPPTSTSGTLGSRDGQEKKPRSFADEFPSLKESHAPKPVGVRRGRVRPAGLLPDGPAGASRSLVRLMETYRARVAETRARRGACLERAQSCAQRADTAGAQAWTAEGEEWTRKLVAECRTTAGSVVAERNRLVKDAVRELRDRASRADEPADRMQRGKEMGGGVCLGVAKAGPGAGTGTKERVEVLVDIHGLEPEDGVFYLERFLVGLKTEGFQGLGYVMISTPEGQMNDTPDSTEPTIENGKGTSTEEVGMGEKKEGAGGEMKRGVEREKELVKAVKNWLDIKKYEWVGFGGSGSFGVGGKDGDGADGVICVDPLSV